MTIHRGRRAAVVENAHLRVTVLAEGGHIAELFDKRTSISPLWTPPWPSIEPSSFDERARDTYGGSVDGPLLAGIMGHNLCLDLFGPPSSEEEAAGLTAHGEAPIVGYELAVAGTTLVARAHLPLAQIRIERRLELIDRSVRVEEQVENLAAFDRPIAWTEHVTLGPPFLERGITQFRASATQSQVFESTFGVADYLQPGALFDWPLAPRVDGGSEDQRRLTAAPASSAYTAHLMDPVRDDAFFVAFSPSLHLFVGYVWTRRDFPWLGIWEENCSRTNTPWNGHTLARGMEFGASPFPEPRRTAVERGRLFGTPTYRWLPAQTRLSTESWAVVGTADRAPETLDRPRSVLQ